MFFGLYSMIWQKHYFGTTQCFICMFIQNKEDLMVKQKPNTTNSLQTLTYKAGILVFHDEIIK